MGIAGATPTATRMSAMARAIAGRLLHEPTLRLKRSSGEDDSYLYVECPARAVRS